MGTFDFSHQDHDFKTVAATSFMMLPPPQTTEENDSRVSGIEDLPIFSVTSEGNITSLEDSARTPGSRSVAPLSSTSGVTSHPSEAPPSYQECIGLNN